MANNPFVQTLYDCKSPDHIKQFVKSLDEESDEAILVLLDAAETSFITLHGKFKANHSTVTTEDINEFRKLLIALQLFAQQMIGPATMVSNLERIFLNIIMPIIGLCGNLDSIPATTLKVDAVGITCRLLQAYEDQQVAHVGHVLDFVCDQFHRLCNPPLPPIDTTFNPLDAISKKQLVTEFVLQCVELVGTMAYLFPTKLVPYSPALLSRGCDCLNYFTDSSLRYELIDLIGQLCALAVRMPDDDDEDFLDAEMRRIQSNEQQSNPTTQSTTPENQYHEVTTPFWTPSVGDEEDLPLRISLPLLSRTLQTIISLFEQEEYDSDDAMVGADSEDDEDDEMDDDTSTNELMGSDDFHRVDFKHKSGAENSDKRRQEESGAAVTTSLLASVMMHYGNSEAGHSSFEAAYDALSRKILSFTTDPTTFARLIFPVDALVMLLFHAPKSNIQSIYSNLFAHLESLLKSLIVWKNNAPSKRSRAVCNKLKSSISKLLTILISKDPNASFAQYQHIMASTVHVVSDPTLMAEFATACASLVEPASLAAEAKKILVENILVTFVDSFLKDLSNPEVSDSFKQTVMISLGRMAFGVGELFSSFVEVTAPVLLVMGRQSPELAPAALSAVSQILASVQNFPVIATDLLVSSCQYAIAMIMEDVLYAGSETNPSTDPTTEQIASELIRFEFKKKEPSMTADEEEDGIDEEDMEEPFDDDLLSDFVYKGECFMAFVTHNSALVELIGQTDHGMWLEKMFDSLITIQEKPSLFDEDYTLKMNAVDILLHMVSSIPKIHTSSHKLRALKALAQADIQEFEQELASSIAKLEAVELS